MSVITTGNIIDMLDLNLKEAWQDGIKRWDNEYDKIFEVLDSDKQSERVSYETGFIAMPVKDEGVAARYDTITPGIRTTYTHATYALGYEITEEAIEDNKQTPETFAKLPQALAGSGEETVEVSAANVLNNGFSTTGFDGKVLFASDHPLVGSSGGTQSNLLSTAADLSVTSLQAAITAFGQMVDEKGLHRALRPTRLLVGVANQFVAEELLKSEYKPYTANNEVNAIMSKQLTFMINHYLTDDDAWFLLADKANCHLKFWWRVRPGALRRSTDFDSTNLKHLARMRFSVGYDHYMGTFGTPGA